MKRPSISGNTLKKADEEVKSAKAGENTDLASYEADLESNYRAFQDIQDELICISNILRWKRMNRELLSDHVKRIKTIISNQI